MVDGWMDGWIGVLGVSVFFYVSLLFENVRKLESMDYFVFICYG